MLSTTVLLASYCSKLGSYVPGDYYFMLQDYLLSIDPPRKKNVVDREPSAAKNQKTNQDGRQK